MVGDRFTASSSYGRSRLTSFRMTARFVLGLIVAGAGRLTRPEVGASADVLPVVSGTSGFGKRTGCACKWDDDSPGSMSITYGTKDVTSKQEVVRNCSRDDVNITTLLLTGNSAADEFPDLCQFKNLQKVIIERFSLLNSSRLSCLQELRDLTIHTGKLSNEYLPMNTSGLENESRDNITSVIVDKSPLTIDELVRHWNDLALLDQTRRPDLEREQSASLTPEYDLVFEELVRLDLSDNQLTDFPRLGRMLNLSEVKFMRNNLTRLELGWFENSSGLVELDFSENVISGIERGVFDCRRRSLTKLDISRNQLSKLENFTFIDLFGLKLLNLSWNLIEDIEASAFSTSENLEVGCADSDVDRSSETSTVLNETPPLREEAACSYEHWPLLETLDLSHNSLTTVVQAMFRPSLCGVRHLRLGYNRIVHMPRYVVEQLRQLESLELQHNDIFWLDVGTFTNPNLRRVDLSHNALRKLISMSFLYLPTIVEVDLSYNQIGYIYRYAFYRVCRDDGHRVRISLRGNRLLTDGVWKMLSILQHRENEQCTVEVDLRDNRVEHFIGSGVVDAVRRQVESGQLEKLGHWDRMKVDLTGNIIQCDCELADEIALIEYASRYYNVEEVSTATLNRSSGSESWDGGLAIAWRDLNCSGPDIFEGFSISEFLAYALCPDRLPLGSPCPGPCDCSTDDEVSSSVNCSRRGLTTIPDVRFQNSTSVDLSHNDLTHIDAAAAMLVRRVRHLDLSSNRIRSIDDESLRYLSTAEQILLHDNQLRAIPARMLHTLSSNLRVLTLRDNPLSCSCTDFVWLGSIMAVKHLVVDWDEVRCSNGRHPDSINFSSDYGCGYENEMLLPPAPALRTLSQPSQHPDVQTILVVVVFLVLAAAGAALVRLRRVRVGMWSSLHRGQWRRIENHRRRRDAVRHDLFISYCDADEAWVTGTLLEVIWNRNPHYDVYLQQHMIDADDGGCGADSTGFSVESEQLHRSIVSSQVVIVVISGPFVKNLWSVDVAYRELILEKLVSQRHNFVFVVRGTVDLDDGDSEFFGYVTENKCLSEDDPLFAAKLVDALPHPRHVTQSSESEKGALIYYDNSLSRYHTQRY